MKCGKKKVEDKEKKVKTRPKFADEKYLGSEPTVTEDSTQSELAVAYNWFNYFYTSDDAKAFTISYLKSIHYDKHVINKLSRVKSVELHSIGWNCRLLTTGSTLPREVWKSVEERILSLASEVLEVSASEEDGEKNQVPVISIQDRINSKASDLIAELEEELDVFYKEGVIQFDVKKWSLEKAIKPPVAKRITDHFRPQYEEITEALKGEDPDFVEAYKGWRKPVLKIMALFIKKILDHLDEAAAAQVSIRKPRKKKEKPAHVLVSKLKYKVEDKDLNIKSVQSKDIIHAQQLWVYNTKYRNLSVYNALGPSGLSVRGTTIIGYDQDTSITKKLRKPEQVIPQVLNEGKVGLRKIMSVIKTTETKANGRCNEETILLRIVR
jgi:hypothetical protein